MGNVRDVWGKSRDAEYFVVSFLVSKFFALWVIYDP